MRLTSRHVGILLAVLSTAAMVLFLITVSQMTLAQDGGSAGDSSGDGVTGQCSIFDLDACNTPTPRPPVIDPCFADPDLPQCQPPTATPVPPTATPRPTSTPRPTPTPNLDVSVIYDGRPIQDNNSHWGVLHSSGVRVHVNVSTPVSTHYEFRLIVDPVATGFQINRSSGASVACTDPADDYPHIGSRQSFWIEDPPHWGHLPDDEEWTIQFSIAAKEEDSFEYLPWVLIHEFGHTIGLGHSAESGTIMGGSPRELEPCSTPAPVPAPSPTPTPFPCGLSDYDNKGAEAIISRIPSTLPFPFHRMQDDDPLMLEKA